MEEAACSSSSSSDKSERVGRLRALNLRRVRFKHVFVNSSVIYALSTVFENGYLPCTFLVFMHRSALVF